MRYSLFLLLLLSSLVSANNQSVRIAIIIDDIGNNLKLGQRAVDLPGALTLSVLPHTPVAKRLARAGHYAGKQIMLHAPMSNNHQKRLGPGALTETLEKALFIETLNNNIDNIPFAKGVNNHMGSYLTQQKQQMEWVMQTLKERNLFFIDSLTHSGSVAYKTAKEYQLPTAKRQVFLDNSTDPSDILNAFNRLLSIAKRKGSAIAIGHPYSETLDVLAQQLPTLAEHNIELVHASKLLSQPKAENIQPQEAKPATAQQISSSTP